MDAGLPADTSLYHLLAGPLRRRTQAWVREAVSALETGVPVSAAWGPRVPAMLRTLLRAGEASGQMVQVLRLWVGYEQRRRHWRARYWRAFSYPCLVAATTLSAMAFCSRILVPTLQQVYAQMRVPVPLSMRWTAFCLGAVPVAALAGAGVTAAVGGAMYLRSRMAPGACRPVRLPFVAGVLRTARTGQFCAWLFVLVNAGVPLVEALRAMEQSGGPAWMRQESGRIARRILEGMTLTESFVGDWDPLLGALLHAAEATGDVSAALQRMQRHAESEVERRLDRWVRAAEPALTAVLAGLVGLTLFAVFNPMYDAVNALAAGAGTGPGR
ncbi:MAG: type II secretion system F family protein [Alicyclobacillus sp.]|nr:type II secretion system F family protein [Alicyclobacillus sp.]